MRAGYTEGKRGKQKVKAHEKNRTIKDKTKREKNY